MKPDIEPMFTMLPRPCRSIAAPNARQHRKVPFRLTSITLFQTSSDMVSAGWLEMAMPALLTRMSTVPWRSMMAAWAASTCPASLTSSSCWSTGGPCAGQRRGAGPRGSAGVGGAVGLGWDCGDDGAGPGLGRGLRAGLAYALCGAGDHGGFSMEFESVENHRKSWSLHLIELAFECRPQRIAVGAANPFGKLHAARGRLRPANDAHAGTQARAGPGVAVFHHHAVLGVPPQQPGGAQIGFGLGLALAHVVA